jgi:NTP pyrophosphatase (non-canonical NTP hydrolase)
MEFNDLIQKAYNVREAYAELARRKYGRTWTAEEIALGFMGDVGDLMKLIQACEGIRDIPDAKAKIAHELADCLWSIMILSQEYEVDLESAFTETMESLEKHLSQNQPQ